MADYYRLLSRAVATERAQTRAEREAIYRRAHGALVQQLPAMDPPMSRDEMEAEVDALVAAIAQVEADYAPQVPQAPERHAPAAHAPEHSAPVRRAPPPVHPAEPPPQRRTTPAPVHPAEPASSGPRYVRQPLRPRGPASPLPPPEAMPPPEMDFATDISRDMGPLPDVPEESRGSSRKMMAAILAVVLIAILGGGGYAAWKIYGAVSPKLAAKPTPAPAARSTPPPQSATQSAAPAASAAQPAPAATQVASAGTPAIEVEIADLKPGVDGGSTDADLPYFYRRQPVFYRSTYPAGTIVIDKTQRFIYLVQSPTSASRYGIGVGVGCYDLAGLMRVQRKQEWPPWKPSASAQPIAGGPGNPLGAGAFFREGDVFVVHGTNTPKAIGRVASFGCIRLTNDDVADLLKRVEPGAAIVITR